MLDHGKLTTTSAIDGYMMKMMIMLKDVSIGWAMENIRIDEKRRKALKARIRFLFLPKAYNIFMRINVF